jgi:hypothetical protein
VLISNLLRTRNLPFRFLCIINDSSKISTVDLVLDDSVLFCVCSLFIISISLA